MGGGDIKLLAMVGGSGLEAGTPDDHDRFARQFGRCRFDRVRCYETRRIYSLRAFPPWERLSLFLSSQPLLDWYRIYSALPSSP
jgi:hypothetical protein